MSEYRFSIIIAVYNTEEFLRETLECVLSQDFDFKYVQLILVDDGSTDGSANICDEYAAKYPDNILALHKTNGGVSSARNFGLQYARGKYVNFLDSDDLFSRNTLKDVWRFFEKHYSEIDVVSTPLFHFGGYDLSNPLNDKFERGSRVIDFRKEQKFFQNNSSSCFIKRDVIRAFHFEERVKIGEDWLMMNLLLLGKLALGVLDSCKYLYRVRTAGDASAMQSKVISKRISGVDSQFSPLIDCAMKTYGKIPPFTQYALLQEIANFLRYTKKNALAEGIDENEITNCRNLIIDALKKLDDEIVYDGVPRKFSIVDKFLIFSAKYGNCTIRNIDGELSAIFPGCTKSLAPGRFELDFFDVTDGKIVIGGTFLLYRGIEENLTIFAKCKECEFESEIISILPGKDFLGELLYKKFCVRLVIPVASLPGNGNISIFARIGEACAELSLAGKKFFPISRDPGYYIAGGIRFTLRGRNIGFCRSTKGAKAELRLLGKLLKKRAWGVAFWRSAYALRRIFKKKPVWLFCDRFFSADDNAEVLFDFVNKNHPEIRSYFVLDRHSPDYPRLRKIGKVVQPYSRRHKMLAMLSDRLISSSAEEEVFNPFCEDRKNYQDIFANKKRVFLQHGVICGDLSRSLDRHHGNFAGFVTSAERERASIIEGQDYFYAPEQIWLTGMPRFDNLYHDEKKFITIAPSWRRELLAAPDKKGGILRCRLDAGSSDYIKFYNELLTDKTLLDAVDKYGYKINFKPHPVLQPYPNLFKFDDRVKILSAGDRYNDVFARSSLLVTDYSSAVFDFAYLRKAVVYVQFDREKYFLRNTPGYFDYEKDGFGEVEYTKEALVARIIEYMQNDCRLKDEYRRRIDSFFAFNDRYNCQRVFDRIVALSSLPE